MVTQEAFVTSSFFLRTDILDRKVNNKMHFYINLKQKADNCGKATVYIHHANFQNTHIFLDNLNLHVNDSTFSNSFLVSNSSFLNSNSTHSLTTSLVFRSIFYSSGKFRAHLYPEQFLHFHGYFDSVEVAHCSFLEGGTIGLAFTGEYVRNITVSHSHFHKLWAFVACDGVHLETLQIVSTYFSQNWQLMHFEKCDVKRVFLVNTSCTNLGVGDNFKEQKGIELTEHPFWNFSCSGAIVLFNSAV